MIPAEVPQAQIPSLQMIVAVQRRLWDSVCLCCMLSPPRAAGCQCRWVETCEGSTPTAFYFHFLLRTAAESAHRVSLQAGALTGDTLSRFILMVCCQGSSDPVQTGSGSAVTLG